MPDPAHRIPSLASVGPVGKRPGITGAYLPLQEQAVVLLGLQHHGSRSVTSLLLEEDHSQSQGKNLWAG